MKIIPIQSAPVLTHPEVIRSHMPPLGRGRWRYLRENEAKLQPSRQKLLALRGIHQGRRAFVIGNGPSIASMDLSPLKNEIGFAVNSTFRLYPKLGFVFPYTCFSDRVRWSEAGSQVIEASPGSQMFYCDDWEVPTPADLMSEEQLEQVILCQQAYRLPSWLHAWVPLHNRAGFCTYHAFKHKGFRWDVPNGLSTGNSVIFMATQLAVWMGCNPVILLGVDMDYSGPAKHFHGQKVWTPPMDYERDAKPYFVQFRKEMETRGVRFLNGGVGGRVDALERVPFTSLFG